jgi:DNA repair photolyase
MAASTAPSLFPIVPPHRDNRQPSPSPPEADAKRTGIARLAASSPLADAKREAEYFLLPVRSILNYSDSDRLPFRWTVNPYRGCEFGCKYCYARYTHEYMDLDGADFEHKIFVKQDAGPIAARDLLSVAERGELIAIGTATDPYQPAEREFGATRAILEQMANFEGLRLSITTKSNQVVRDVDVLQQIARRSTLQINLTVTTHRTRLARLIEPLAPRPDLRLGAVRTLRDAGLAAGVFVMPVIPGITDREEDLDALALAARDAGAQWFSANVLFLMSSAREQFFPFLEKKFPRLVRQYRQWYEHAGYAPESYRHEISQRISAIRTKYGLASASPAATAEARSSPQMALFKER